MNWRDLQEETADLFRQLGCAVSVEHSIRGARGTHVVDVFVEFKSFGIPTTWIIECKHWKSNVTKEKVLALKSISDDLGADRAVIVSTSGFQAGAIKCTENTNITLTDLDGLRELTADHAISMSLLDLESRGYKVRHGLNSLYRTQKHDKHHWSSKPVHESVDGRAVMTCLGQFASLQYGFERARLGTPPYNCGWTEDGNSIICTDDLQEFMEYANEIVAAGELLLEHQLQAIKGDA